jgi:diguanylate cyclase (GGDEF)-like protein
MFGASFNRKRVKLKKLIGIRTRLALLALVLVAPLMLERARSLENTRARQVAAVSVELKDLAQHSANTLREIISSVETIMKSTAYVRASARDAGRGCDMLRASLPVNLPWIRSLLIVGRDGLVQCSTQSSLVGLDLSDRGYFKTAQETRDLVFSDFLFAKSDGKPIMIAAYPASAFDDAADSVIVAGVNLDWVSNFMGKLGGRPGISAVLVDSAGVVLAAPENRANLVGRALSTLPMLSSVAEKVVGSDKAEGSFSFTASDGSQRALNFSRIAGTQSRLIVSVDEAQVSADIDREIRTAYLQLGFVCLFVLLGALAAAEKLIIRPIETIAAMAKRFGQGEWAVRAESSRLPTEFVPLARAFNKMAAQLSERERELIANNDRLTVMASIDMLSGLANRRGFQSRLDYEWMRAQQYHGELSLLMIDVDHFKPFNDTYGHPEGDACLARLGEALAGIAAETMGFAGRYGGEEFCLLLPNTNVDRALEIGEMVRAAVQDLEIPHSTSDHETVTVSVGVACVKPSDQQHPGDLIEAADASLYAAKRQGRNAVAEHGLEHGLGQTADDGDPLALAS